MNHIYDFNVESFFWKPYNTSLTTYATKFYDQVMHFFLNIKFILYKFFVDKSGVNITFHVINLDIWFIVMSRAQWEADTKLCLIGIQPRLNIYILIYILYNNMWRVYWDCEMFPQPDMAPLVNSTEEDYLYLLDSLEADNCSCTYLHRFAPTVGNIKYQQDRRTFSSQPNFFLVTDFIYYRKHLVDQSRQD